MNAFSNKRRPSPTTAKRWSWTRGGGGVVCGWPGCSWRAVTPRNLSRISKSCNATTRRTRKCASPWRNAAIWKARRIRRSSYSIGRLARTPTPLTRWFCAVSWRASGGNWSKARSGCGDPWPSVPWTAAALYGFYQCLEKQGKESEATKVLARQKAVEADLARLKTLLNPEVERMAVDPDLLSEVGAIWLRLGEDRSGLAWLFQALRENENHTPSHEILLHYYESKGDTQMAAQHRAPARPAERTGPSFVLPRNAERHNKLASGNPSPLVSSETLAYRSHDDNRCRKYSATGRPLKSRPPPDGPVGSV